jgi:hypothetical protein
MRLTICLAAALALSASTTPALAKHTKHAAFQIDGTSWMFTDKKLGKVIESVDTDGNFIANTAKGKHLDHGTAVMKDNKACFTSAMTKEGEVCWTTAPVAIGHSLVTTSNKGRKLRVTRVKYVALKMPG